jgi:cation diffusion facilitator CzcD-associated flavoprotein CzcO
VAGHNCNWLGVHSEVPSAEYGVCSEEVHPGLGRFGDLQGYVSAGHLPILELNLAGTLLHPSFWPHDGPDLRGKRIAIIGTGSTGVQLATELAKVAGHLTVFQRTPNMALPMKQVHYDPPAQAFPRDQYPDLFTHRKDSFSGFSFNFIPRSTFADTAAQRREVYEDLWARGDFQFWLATYVDMLFDPRANEEAYNFWCEKTRARIQDEQARDVLAPRKQPHAFGCKRISLEKGYFEIFNQEHVRLVDVSEKGSPIQCVTEKGIKTKAGEHELDVIVCATGYDAVTGGLTQIDIRGRDGVSLKDAWKEGAKTYLGMASHGFPNMFFTYGPQAPTALCNGPTCAELQGDWILTVMNHTRQRGYSTVEVQEQAQQDWKELIWKLASASLLPTVDSWYMGTNVPGKSREPLIYLGGVPTYYRTLEKVAEKGYEGFTVK